MLDLNGQTVLVIGGSSGIGFGVARAAMDAGAIVTIASRSADKLAAAQGRLGPGCHSRPLDTADADQIDHFFKESAPFDHVLVSAAQTRVAPVRDLPLEDAYASVNSKFWGAYRVARAARIQPGGSLTLVSGFLSVRPRKGAAIQSAINAALEGLTRGLALELAPVRVNCLSPGLVKTEMIDALKNDTRKTMFDDVAARLPVGLVATADQVAIQALAFMANPYMSGSTVFVDGGGAIA